MGSDKDGFVKNWEVVRREWEDYQIQVAVVWERVNRAEGWQRKLRHLSGLGPDILRIMRETLCYGAWALATGLVVWGVCVVVM